MERDDMILRLQETTDRSLRNESRIQALEAEQNALRELTTSVSTLATRQGILEGDVKEIKSDVKSIAGKAGKRWDELVNKLIWAFLAAVASFLLGRLGL